MSRSKVGMLMAIMALSGLLAAEAGAAEWHTNGHKSFSTTNGGPSRWLVHGPGGPVYVECGSSGATGTLRGPTVAGTTALSIATVTPVVGGPCVVSGTPGFTITCRAAELNALGYFGGTTLGAAGGGVTRTSISSIDCTIGAAGVQCSTITGVVNAHYINPAPLNSATPSLLTVTAAGQLLTASKIGAGCGWIPHGAATLGKPGVGSTVTDITYVIDGPDAPWMFRTP